MNYKYTADGRKVVVIGSLNAKESIVQEVYVCDGTELPAGEHFVVKTLLDAPAETYKAKTERELEARIKKLEADRDRISKEISQFRFASNAAAAKIRWIQGITNPEVERVFEQIKAAICGEYTHAVFHNYDTQEILEWDAKLFSKGDTYGKFEAVRLVSLFGHWNGRLEMDWRVSTYQDGSGSSSSFTPCRSYQEAIEVAADKINSKDYITDKDVAFCLKYGIAIDETKNLERLRNKRESKEIDIKNATDRLRKLEVELSDIK